MNLNETKERMKGSITLKVIGIAILALLLLIPASMVISLIREREAAFNEVAQEIGQKWGFPQTLTGPIISIPYLTHYLESNGKVSTTKSFAHFLPETLKVEANLKPEVRYRGIYSVIVYNTTMQISGVFPKPTFSEWKVEEKDILWDEAFVEMGLSDMRGINKQVFFKVDDKEYELNPGCSKDIFETGLSASIKSFSSKMNFSTEVNLNGSNQLYFTPMGKTTYVSLESTWSNPSFDGAFLPKDRTITEKGFSAKWSILHLNRSYPQQWTGSTYQVDNSQFGVRFLLPVDHYQKAMRSAKYAIMFIGLTFLAFFFIETINGKRIHPIQYLLVGAALCIFYTLLLSLSEQVGFTWAYLIAATGIIGLISIYARSILNSNKLGGITTGILVILYLFLFTILQLQDYALLMGSIGLFLVLAIVMYISKKINWYGE